MAGVCPNTGLTRLVEAFFAANDTSITAVLSQIDGKKEHMIVYASRILTKTERNYYVTKRELLAVVTFLQHF